MIIVKYLIATIAGAGEAFSVLRQVKLGETISATPAPIIGISLTAYLLLYVLLLSAYVSVLFYLARHRGKPDHKPAVAGLQEA